MEGGKEGEGREEEREGKRETQRHREKYSKKGKSCNASIIEAAVCKSQPLKANYNIPRLFCFKGKNSGGSHSPNHGDSLVIRQQPASLLRMHS